MRKKNPHTTKNCCNKQCIKLLWNGKEPLVKEIMTELYNNKINLKYFLTSNKRKNPKPVIVNIYNNHFVLRVSVKGPSPILIT